MNESKNDIINEYLFLINCVEKNVANRTKNATFVIKEKAKIEPRENNISASILNKSIGSKSEQNLQPPNTSLKKEVSSQPQNEKPLLTPSVLKREFLKCMRCSLSNPTNRVLGEGCDFRPLVFLITDTLLNDEERVYLDTVLKAFHLNTTTNAYITSLVKCKAGNILVPNDAFVKCSRLLRMQFMLYRPLSAIAFGPSAASFLESLKTKDEFKNMAFISTLPLRELKDNKDEKKKLITSFNKLARVLNIARV